jgi:hypothetical protein
MSYPIPTLAELEAQHIARLESALGQNAPTNDKAFLRILSKSEAAMDTGLYKYAANRVKANLALTAISEDLDAIGNNENTPRKLSEPAELTATLPANTGVIITTSNEFIADANGLRYKPIADVTAVANVATLTLKCVESGSSGSLDIGDELQISAQVSGAQTTATVSAVVQDGIDIESDSDYRPRVIFAQRAITGGGNATDHKIWAESVIGVKQAFPYAGRPVDEGTSYPGDRQVYIESTASVDADGIAPSWLLDLVRIAINTDPDTGYSRAALGQTDATLFLRSISRTAIFVEVRDLVVDADKDAACRAAIVTACTLYFATIRPFVDGIDVPQERTDEITSMSIGRIVQDALKSYGATATSVGFGLAVGVFIPSYTLGIGELTKLGGVAYA